MAKAVGYLHDHGIVHRDLKPGNIFLENGILKIGDYGLCKFISSSQRTAQTQSVGTVYYMAPEISTGNYNKQIDIYAAGIVLYEMLTGRVPFEGESAGEILMKHLTSPPDLTKLPAEYIPIVGKALAKNPAQRYVTIAEMAKAVEAVGIPGGARASVNGHANGVPHASVPPALAREQPEVVKVPPYRPSAKKWITSQRSCRRSRRAAKWWSYRARLPWRPFWPCCWRHFTWHSSSPSLAEPLAGMKWGRCSS